METLCFPERVAGVLSCAQCAELKLSEDMMVSVETQGTQTKEGL